MAFNRIYALANEICDKLGGLLELSNSNDASVYAPLLAGQDSIETVRANSANTMNLPGIIHPVQQPVPATTFAGSRPESAVRSHEDRASCPGSMLAARSQGLYKAEEFIP